MTINENKKLSRIRKRRIKIDDNLKTLLDQFETETKKKY